MTTLPATPGEDELAQARWFKSSRSESTTGCIEVAHLRNGAAVRDSKNPGGDALFFAAHTWTRFLGAARDGRIGCG